MTNALFPKCNCAFAELRNFLSFCCPPSLHSRTCHWDVQPSTSKHNSQTRLLHTRKGNRQIRLTCTLPTNPLPAFGAFSAPTVPTYIIVHSHSNSHRPHIPDKHLETHTCLMRTSLHRFQPCPQCCGKQRALPNQTHERYHANEDLS